MTDTGRGGAHIWRKPSTRISLKSKNKKKEVISGRWQFCRPRLLLIVIFLLCWFGRVQQVFRRPLKAISAVGPQLGNSEALDDDLLDQSQLSDSISLTLAFVFLPRLYSHFLNLLTSLLVCCLVKSTRSSKFLPLPKFFYSCLTLPAAHLNLQQLANVLIAIFMNLHCHWYVQTFDWWFMQLYILKPFGIKICFPFFVFPSSSRS